METPAIDHLDAARHADVFRGTIYEAALRNLAMSKHRREYANGVLYRCGHMTTSGHLTRSGRRVLLFLTPTLKVPGNLVRHALELASPYRGRDPLITETCESLEQAYNVPGREAETLTAWRHLYDLLDQVP